MNRHKMAFAALNLTMISLLAALLFNLLTINPAYPRHAMDTDARRPLFKWAGMQGEFNISIDDDPDFSSPVMASINANEYLPQYDMDFGTYYWKVESGPFSSGTSMFTVVSNVIVSRNSSALKNEGNVPLVISSSGITGAIILKADETVKIGENENVKAEQA